MQRRLAIVEPSATALIAQHVVMAAGVVHHQLMAAAPAVQQAGQQRRPALGGAHLRRTARHSAEMVACMRSNSSQLT